MQDGFWNENLKVGLFGKKEKRREGKIGWIKMEAEITIFYPPNIGSKSFREIFLPKQLKANYSFLFFNLKKKNKWIKQGICR